jgi:hypothetical protein
MPLSQSFLHEMLHADESFRLHHKKRRELLKLQISRCRESKEVKASMLPPPNKSVWYHIYGKRRDTACGESLFLTYLGISPRKYCRLLRLFTPYYRPAYVNSFKKGRPLRILPHQALAVLLMFYCTTADPKVIGLVHNLTRRRVNATIHKTEPMLSRVLLRFPEASIKWPTLEEQQTAGVRIQSKFPLVRGRFGFVDGKNLCVLHSGDVEKQNSQYNGWLHDCFVTGVLVFNADGLLIWAKHNCPGSWNDGDMCFELCQKLVDPTKTLVDHGLCADTAFPAGQALFRHIVSPLKEGELEKMEPSLQPAANAVSAQITSLRQACEWGMGSIQKPFKRLLLDLPWQDSVRERRLSNIFMLWNIRVRDTGISQIRESFGD